MANVTVYLKCEKNVEVQGDDVYLRDLGSLHSSDNAVSARLKAIKVYHFGKVDSNRCVISVTKLISLMENTCNNISVEALGETDVLVEKIAVNQTKGWKVWGKIVLVCFVTFFGTAFTIMAYHNDIGIQDVFREVYRIFMGRDPDGVNVLEVSYSIGLALGIVLFFNHVGKRRITKDPTPIEVAMRNYERDVNDALIETAEREGKEIDS
jgi:stage V sporulation protein AA